jgi:hypothetical protein
MTSLITFCVGLVGFNRFTRGISSHLAPKEDPKQAEWGVGKAVVSQWRPQSRSSSLITLIGGPHPQCSRNTGTLACSSMERVQPPKISCCSGPVL